MLGAKSLNFYEIQKAFPQTVFSNLLDNRKSYNIPESFYPKWIFITNAFTVPNFTLTYNSTNYFAIPTLLAIFDNGESITNVSTQEELDNAILDNNVRNIYVRDGNYTVSVFRGNKRLICSRNVELDFNISNSGSSAMLILANNARIKLTYCPATMSYLGMYLIIAGGFVFDNTSNGNFNRLYLIGSVARLNGYSNYNVYSYCSQIILNNVQGTGILNSNTEKTLLITSTPSSFSSYDVYIPSQYYIVNLPGGYQIVELPESDREYPAFNYLDNYANYIYVYSQNYIDTINYPKLVLKLIKNQKLFLTEYEYNYILELPQTRIISDSLKTFLLTSFTQQKIIAIDVTDFIYNLLKKYSPTNFVFRPTLTYMAWDYSEKSFKLTNYTEDIANSPFGFYYFLNNVVAYTDFGFEAICEKDKNLFYPTLLSKPFNVKDFLIDVLRAVFYFDPGFKIYAVIKEVEELSTPVYEYKNAPLNARFVLKVLTADEISYKKLIFV